MLRPLYELSIGDYFMLVTYSQDESVDESLREFTQLERVTVCRVLQKDALEIVSKEILVHVNGAWHRAEDSITSHDPTTLVTKCKMHYSELFTIESLALHSYFLHEGCVYSKMESHCLRVMRGNEPASGKVVIDPRTVVTPCKLGITVCT